MVKEASQHNLNAKLMLLLPHKKRDLSFNPNPFLYNLC